MSHELLKIEKKKLFQSTLEPMFNMMRNTVVAINESYHDEISTYKERHNEAYLHLPNKTIDILDEYVSGIGEIVNSFTVDDLKNVDFIFSDEKSLHDMLIRLRDYHIGLVKIVEKLHDEVTSLRDKSILENHLKLDRNISFLLIEMRIVTSFLLSQLKQFDVSLSMIEYSYEKNKYEVYRWQDD